MTFLIQISICTKSFLSQWKPFGLISLGLAPLIHHIWVTRYKTIGSLTALFVANISKFGKFWQKMVMIRNLHFYIILKFYLFQKKTTLFYHVIFWLQHPILAIFIQNGVYPTNLSHYLDFCPKWGIFEVSIQFSWF